MTNNGLKLKLLTNDTLIIYKLKTDFSIKQSKKGSHAVKTNLPKIIWYR